MSNYFNVECATCGGAGLEEGFNRGGAGLQAAIDKREELVVAFEIKEQLMDYSPTRLDELVEWLGKHMKCSIQVVDEYGRRA